MLKNGLVNDLATNNMTVEAMLDYDPDNQKDPLNIEVQRLIRQHDRTIRDMFDKSTSQYGDQIPEEVIEKLGGKLYHLILDSQEKERQELVRQTELGKAFGARNQWGRENN